MGLELRLDSNPVVRESPWRPLVAAINDRSVWIPPRALALLDWAARWSHRRLDRTFRSPTVGVRIVVSRSHALS